MSQPILPSISSFPTADTNPVIGHRRTAEASKTSVDQPAPTFVDRRGEAASSRRRPASANDERRQFGSSHAGLTEDGRELAIAIDQYKLQNHRRYITCDEMLSVIRGLGYERS